MSSLARGRGEARGPGKDSKAMSKNTWTTLRTATFQPLTTTPKKSTLGLGPAVCPEPIPLAHCPHVHHPPGSQLTSFRFQSTRLRSQLTRLRFQLTRFRFQLTRFRSQGGLGVRTGGMSCADPACSLSPCPLSWFGVWALGNRRWGVGFGVQGLRFGV